MKKLYIGNLPYSTKDDDLAQMFSDYGTVVSASVIFDRATNRSKGFGFVEIEEDDGADKAIAEMDGKDMGGRNIKVSEARPKTDRR